MNRALWWLHCIGALVLLGGCRPEIAVRQQVEASVTQIPETEEEDLGCAYYYFLSGRYAELGLNFEEALEAYQKAMICDPAASYVSGRIPILLIRLERPQEAMEWLTGYLARHPADRNIRMLYARVLVREEAFDAAAEQYRMVHEQDPRDTAPLILLSELAMTRGLIDKAETNLKQVLEINPQSHAALVLLARLYRGEHPEEALVRYEEALDVSWSAALVMEVAEFLATGERYAESAARYREVLEVDRDNEDARIALVHMLLLQEKEDEALQELELLKAQTDSPQRVDITIARLYARKKQYTKAAAVLENLLEQTESAQARYLLSIVYFQMKEHDLALSELQRIDRMAEEYEDALFLQARILRATDRLDDAVQILEEALDDEATRTPEMFAMLATLYQIQGMGQKGADTFTRGVSVFPQDDKLLYEFGLFLEQSGEHLQAMDVMQQVIALEPDNAGALNFVGYTWADKKVHLDQALNYIRRAAELQPDNGYIRDSLGWVHYRLGNLEEALRHLLEAIRLSPDDYAIFDHLGDVYLELGRVEEAREAYAQALDLAEDEETRERLRTKLGIIGEQETP